MNPWPYIVAAYVLTLGGGIVVTIWSVMAMRRAERLVETLRDR